MPQSCKICKHPRREAIEAELSGSWERGLRAVGQRYGVSKDSLSRHSQFHMRFVEGGDQAVDGEIGNESASIAERAYQEFVRQWERQLWIAPANLQAAFSMEFNGDRAEKLGGLLAEAVGRGDLVQRAGLYFRIDQLTSRLGATSAAPS
jgi:hypothetical protein